MNQRSHEKKRENKTVQSLKYGHHQSIGKKKDSDTTRPQTARAHTREGGPNRPLNKKRCCSSFWTATAASAPPPPPPPPRAALLEAARLAPSAPAPRSRPPPRPEKENIAQFAPQQPSAQTPRQPEGPPPVAKPRSLFVLLPPTRFSAFAQGAYASLTFSFSFW